MPPELNALQESFRRGVYNISKHGFEEMIEDKVTISQLEIAVGDDAPELIEDYPQDARGPCCLILGWIGDSEPLHVVVGYGGSMPIMVTLYRPDCSPWLWEPNFRNRRI